MSRDEPTTSALQRFLKLSGLMGRVGASVVGSQILGLARSDDNRRLKQTENLVRNATRVVETLGELKGAAMKVGQMLSLHEGVLPPEVAEVLRALQQEAPRVPAEVMEYEVRGAVRNFDDLFESMEPEGFAAASIGQVHRGTLRDGRRVAIKIQYPLIDRIVRADLDNLRRLLQALFGLFSNVDFEPVWNEVRDRLLEELDYTHEAANMRRMAELHADSPEIIVPRVVEEATTRNVLTMAYVPGMSPREACSDRYDQSLRDRWAQVLFRFLMRGLLRTRFLHADPNMANFAFREDGRIVVYDFGCVKRVPETLSRCYAALTRAAIDGRKERVPQILLEMGVSKEDGSPLSREITDPYFDVIAEMYRAAPPYSFGDAEDVYRTILELGVANLGEATDIRFPEEIVFVNRALSGHFGNLNRLRATGPWRDIAGEYVAETPAD